MARICICLDICLAKINEQVVYEPSAGPVQPAHDILGKPTGPLRNFFQKDHRLFSYDHSGTRLLVQIVDLKDIAEDNYLFIHPSRQDQFSSLLRKANLESLSAAAVALSQGY